MIASAAWIAYLMEGGTAVEIASQSCYRSSTSGYFQAEVIALDMALHFAKLLISRNYDRISNLAAPEQ